MSGKQSDLLEEFGELNYFKAKDREVLQKNMWRLYLTLGEKGMYQLMPDWMASYMHMVNHMLGIIPSDPRCVGCNSPFRGVGAPFMRMIGKSQSNLNPSLCNSCETMLVRSEGGADVSLSMVFADIRGSTQLSEKMTPPEFQKLIGRFFTETSKVIIEALGFVDKFIGDEVTCYFVPGVVGDDHAKMAVKVAKEILRVTGHDSPEGPWVPVGVGVSTGVSYVGSVGTMDGRAEMNVLGEVPIIGSRLAGKAKAGEVVISEETFAAAGLDEVGWERAELELKGRSEKQAARIWRV